MTGLSVESPQPGVALVVLDRPGWLNAFDEATVRALPTLLEALAEDPQVRVVVLTGAPGAFCAGGDLALVGTLPLLGAEELEALLLRGFQASALLHSMDKPTIAAVNGPAAGGGLGLALACDLRIAGRDATFVSPFINMGLAPDYGVTWLLPRIVGHAVALEMAVTGRRVGAAEALTTGLVSRLCDDPLAEVLSLAGRIAAQPAQAVALTKRLMRDSAPLDLPTALAAEAKVARAALQSEEFAERWATWRTEISGVTDGRN
ncbi:MAG TPA: enoyl-CoA hydratase/isomerase family protein [Sporichthyaceae bacterium]|nr:enoyl-CoA hydratase/isomerase family protein [Sporichthyaceae bacterium]